MSEFVILIQEHLDRLHMSRADLANSARLSEAMVSRIMADMIGGKGGVNLTVNDVYAISRALHLDYEGTVRLAALAVIRDETLVAGIAEGECVVEVDIRRAERGLPPIARKP